MSLLLPRVVCAHREEASLLFHTRDVVGLQASEGWDRNLWCKCPSPGSTAGGAQRGQPVVALYWNYLEVKLPEEPGLSSGSSEAPAPCSHDPILGGEGAAVAAPYQTMSHPGHICPTAPRGLPALGVQLSAISCTANK